jgi:hypothetical protein
MKQAILLTASLAAASLLMASSASAACRDCHDNPSTLCNICNHTYDKFTCVNGPYAVCSPHTTYCKLDDGGWIVQECDSWCSASGDCQQSVTYHQTPNGNLLASWWTGTVTQPLSACLVAADAD